MKVSQGAVELGAQAGSLSVQIKDSSGTVVRTLGLGEKNAGRHAFDWDGKTDGGIVAKPGDYTFEVQASSQDGKEMQVKTSFAAKVDAITDLANGGRLDTASGKVEAKDILAIRPDTLAAPTAVAPIAVAPTAAAPTAAAPTAAAPAKRERPKAEQKSQADNAAAAANATRPEKPESKPAENKATDSKQNSISNVAKKAS